MNRLRIHTQIHSRYRVFDSSGQLPFSIVFGLCRRSPADTDPRPLLLETAGSALDVPYALAHGLLTLHEQDPEDAKRWVQVDLSWLSNVAPAKGLECLSLPSPVTRTEHWRDAFTIHQCPIEPDGKMTSLLKPGKKYTIKLASDDLGVTRWEYSDRKELIGNDSKPSHGPGAIKIVNSKPTAGKATFKVVNNLPWPPQVETRIHLPLSSSPSDSPLLEVSVLNTGSTPVTVQTRGHQRVLIPWGLFQPAPDALDDRTRIIHATPHKPPTSSLQVIESATGALVRGSQQRGIGSLMASNADRRPKVEDVIQLDPGVPGVRTIDIRALVDGLKDGQYKIRMQAKGCRWWHGEISKEECENGRVPAHLCASAIASPLMLESQDEVELHVRDGKVVF
ncbi:MAG: hypothetical protein LQ346_006719 [Caloplaca aetnensis]|nr:MAG: hypothetical protein LQ346_006719 [Caloplaca aetnensis]